MSWFKKIFIKKSQHTSNTEPKEEELLEKLETSINQCKTGIKEAGDEIDQIRKWASEAIRESYAVTNEFVYEELSKFNEIKLLEENKSIDIKVITKCDEIIEAYLEQIKLRVAKIALYNSLIEKYQQNEDKMKAIKKRHDEDIAARLKLDALEKHSQRIEQMIKSPDNIETSIEESYNLDILKNEANEVFEQFEINEEVRADLEALNKQFNTGSLISDSKLAIEKIESLADKIKMDNKE